MLDATGNTSSCGTAEVGAAPSFVGAVAAGEAESVVGAQPLGHVSSRYP
jgi:hypothetical protein